MGVALDFEIVNHRGEVGHLNHTIELCKELSVALIKRIENHSDNSPTDEQLSDLVQSLSFSLRQFYGILPHAYLEVSRYKAYYADEREMGRTGNIADDALATEIDFLEWIQKRYPHIEFYNHPMAKAHRNFKK